MSSPFPRPAATFQYLLDYNSNTNPRQTGVAAQNTNTQAAIQPLQCLCPVVEVLLLLFFELLAFKKIIPYVLIQIKCRFCYNMITA